MEQKNASDYLDCCKHRASLLAALKSNAGVLVPTTRRKKRLRYTTSSLVLRVPLTLRDIIMLERISHFANNRSRYSDFMKDENGAPLTATK